MTVCVARRPNPFRSRSQPRLATASMRLHPMDRAKPSKSAHKCSHDARSRPAAWVTTSVCGKSSATEVSTAAKTSPSWATQSCRCIVSTSRQRSSGVHCPPRQKLAKCHASGSRHCAASSGAMGTVTGLPRPIHAPQARLPFPNRPKTPCRGHKARRSGP